MENNWIIGKTWVYLSQSIDHQSWGEDFGVGEYSWFGDKVEVKNQRGGGKDINWLYDDDEQRSIYGHILLKWRIEVIQKEGENIFEEIRAVFEGEEGEEIEDRGGGFKYALHWQKDKIEIK